MGSDSQNPNQEPTTYVSNTDPIFCHTLKDHSKGIQIKRGLGSGKFGSKASTIRLSFKEGETQIKQCRPFILGCIKANLLKLDRHPHYCEA